MKEHPHPLKLMMTDSSIVAQYAGKGVLENYRLTLWQPDKEGMFHIVDKMRIACAPIHMGEKHEWLFSELGIDTLIPGSTLHYGNRQIDSSQFGYAWTLKKDTIVPILVY
ncbi:hypothetical protein KQI65_10185 [bacterium]|nr:hypothetical protein [bacterium]